ncbi:DUF4148 domain-containing protein [Caballeronia sp. SEWSISQ10-4 2]|uniref:DUF4148 domain-containing protein n=1 Tax=Caballeronia sp. SEWSISQ10-4 2 TaxID=2937438 RepID=UPI00264FEFA0|nr:DUF4148 domain-containing protein [Caballeronia sp. SEWSISQ10-4 2]MDN7183976.1 DUF4148 domain-containing protein [Caballeronia sp. SEWSISQ10-4 2]
MKNLICAILATVLIAPAVSFAQTSHGPVTRAEVRAELVQLEKAGYQPAAKQNHYPDEIQAAEARVQADNAYASHGNAPANTAAAASASMPVVSAN